MATKKKEQQSPPEFPPDWDQTSTPWPFDESDLVEDPLEDENG
jgi:hypothetical protein